MKEICYKPIGIIHSPFIEPRGTPIQPRSGKGVKGTIEVFPEYEKGLQDLDGFSHIILLYHFHLSTKMSLLAKPFLDDRFHGIFAIRGPNRPNPIGVSVVRLLTIQKSFLYVQDIDIIEGTPLLDIKPYVPEFDSQEVVKIGWLSKNINRLPTVHDDGRFIK